MVGVTGHFEDNAAAPHAILYVPGTGQHLFNQSAAIVADRIARAIQQNIEEKSNLLYRITPTETLPLLAESRLDRVSLEVKSGTQSNDTWIRAVDIYELKYLGAFFSWFSSMPPLSQAAVGCWITMHALASFFLARVCAVRQHKSREEKALNGEKCSPSASDERVLFWYTLKVMVILAIAVSFWLIVAGLAIVGAIKLLGLELPTDLFRHISFLIVAVAILYFALIRNIEAISILAAQSFCVTDYARSHARYLPILYSIRDAAAFLRASGYKRVDLMTLSLGALLAYDAWFPKVEDHHPEIAPLGGVKIENWITLGFPVTMIQWQFPGYFAGRSDGGLQADKLTNIWIERDPIGSRIDSLFGVLDMCAHNVQQLPFIPTSDRYRERGGLFRSRVDNHCLYWDDRDPGALTCFNSLIATGWLDDLMPQMARDVDRPS